MFLFTHVSPSDIFAVGLVPFMISVASVMGKIMLQAFRFKYFITEFIGRNVSSTSSIISAKRNIRLPSFTKKILRKLISKEKADRMIDSTDTAIADLCKMSRENFNSIKTVKVLIVGIAITLAAFLLQGVSFMVLANSVGF